MSSTSQQKSSLSSSLFSAQGMVIAGIVWAVLALLFFLLFSVTVEGEELPLWYSIGTYFFELGAFLGAAIVCYRNWQSPQMVSGRNVWLCIGLGVFFYFIGGVLFGVWELVWHLDPAVSIADAFYVLSYLFLGAGMILAVLSKRVDLEIAQWVALVGVAVAGTAFGLWVASPTFFGLLGSPEPVAIEQQVAAPSVPVPGVSAPKVEKPSTQTRGTPAAESEEETSPAPLWVEAIDSKLEPLEFGVNLFYIIGDVFLLILATALILAFWGGRFSQSWRMIAFAIFSLYIADMYFKWSDSRLEGDYESGGLLEVFFVFTGVLFAVGAILEYDISTRSRQSRRSRRTAKG
ncbi:hypothetical protein PCC9214_02149 [Planktothrix tepida]|uniref:Uncharacterized protein n=2 Tax=Planktothrix TaxID=54304 RepID=A0A1J1LL10_9CYAN|nr:MULTISPECIES: hypothetical protein [Planktothrix]CAD5944522.1 hypothetical protein PCC9214_02149 [Planktothrix tepida]CAD5966579.1 hypothetical protein NO713_03543 [Planktothrix pseudagardhii]CUR32886.1 conserved membrane hypothetical protein [Planktothrix tepida PCC 9214]